MTEENIKSIVKKLKSLDVVKIYYKIGFYVGIVDDIEHGRDVIHLKSGNCPNWSGWSNTISSIEKIVKIDAENQTFEVIYEL
jgi:hypothetical protein